jgi:hypothetical protein
VARRPETIKHFVARLADAMSKADNAAGWSEGERELMGRYYLENAARAVRMTRKWIRFSRPQEDLFRAATKEGT